MPLPQHEYLNSTFAEEDIISQMMNGEPKPLIEGLGTYKSRSIPEGDTNTVELDGMPFIPAFLGVNRAIFGIVKTSRGCGG
jgi:hypothetical protein